MVQILVSMCIRKKIFVLDNWMRGWWGHMWSELGVGTENPRGTGQGRMWEIEEKRREEKRQFLVVVFFLILDRKNKPRLI